MKQYLILSLCIVFSITCLGQKRVNRTKVYFNNEGVILNKVIGWAYDHNTGEWIDWVNCIKEKKLSKKSDFRQHKMESFYQIVLII